MDTMFQSYMEETEEMIQKAEECIIRLEIEYSSNDVNELFRIAHTIKGSSLMMGYDDIGNLMHKIEDMLDYARNGSIPFDQSIVELCFEGLDCVKKMLQYKSEPGSQELMSSIDNDATRIIEMVEAFIRANKKEDEKIAYEEPDIGIISSMLSKKTEGKNKYYVTFFIEEDAPMISAVLMIILNSVGEIGTLVYSSVSDSYFNNDHIDNDIKTFDIIICTDIDEVELYTYLDLFYIEGINIVDLSKSKLNKSDYYFNNGDNTYYIIITRNFITLYNLLFIQPKEFKINKEDIHIIESLNDETANAFTMINNKGKISEFTKEFNEIYSFILRVYDGQMVVAEKILHGIQTKMLKLMERTYTHTKGKYIFSIFKSEKDGFIHRLRDFVEKVNKTSISIILIDLSELDILQANEVKELIQIKKQLENDDIAIAIIAEGNGTRTIINIFDSIKPLEEFNVFRSELDVILGMFHSVKFLNRISKSVKKS